MTAIADDYESLRELVSRIASRDEAAVAELYRLLRGQRYRIQVNLRSESPDDLYHDLIMDLVCQIQNGSLRDPARLMGYANTIALRKIQRRIADVVASRNREATMDEVDFPVPDQAPDPEKLAIRNERTEIAIRILNALSERDREVLVRYYADGQSADQIQSEMGITDTQFRLLKSRAKARYALLCQQRFNRRSCQPALVAAVA